MGPYLAKPETTIHSSFAENDRFIYCTAEMQGWRKTQEDAHSALLNYDDKGSAFFAVFDGHGGEEVSKYCSLYFPNFVKRSIENENFIEAFKNSFLQFDQSLKEPDVIQILRKLASILDPEEIEEDEAIILKKEAQMSLDEIIQGNISQNSENTIPKNGENSKESELKIDDAVNISDLPSNSEESSEIEKKEKNGEVNDASNHVDEAKSEDIDITQKPSSSGTSKNLKGEKSQVLKALNKQIYEAFLSDFDSDEDDEEEEDENEEFEGSDGEDDDEDEEEEEEDEESEDEESAAVDPALANVYITPGGGSGCTAIVALVLNNTLYVANVGDSRCVLSRDGIAVEMSEDHKPEDENEKSRIMKAGGEVTADGRVNGGLNLSRAIGDHLYKKNDKLSDQEQMVIALPDIRTHEIDVNKDQFFFLACDGIWNSMNNQEVVDFINERLQKDMDLKQICEELFNACLAPNTDGDGSGCDNMTCVLVKIKKNTDPKRSLDDSTDEHSEPSKKIKVMDEADLFKAGPSKS